MRSWCRRLVSWLVLAAAALSSSCTGSEADQLDQRLTAAGSSAEDVVLALAELEPQAWWRLGDPSTAALAEATEMIADDLEEVLTVAASGLPGADEPSWQRVDRDVLEVALERLLVEPETHDALAGAVADWLDPRLPAGPAQVTPEAPFDADDARLVHGWARVVDDALEDVDLEARAHWNRAVALAALEAADARERAQGDDVDEPWALAVPAARAIYADRDLDAPVWSVWTFDMTLARVVLPARWLDVAADDVVAAADVDPPAWPGGDDVVEAWREGEDVADHPQAHEVHEALESWLVDEREAGSSLANALRDASSPVDPVTSRHPFLIEPPASEEGPR